ncbi:MAG: hypothetical protein E6Q76_18560 [Rhizobium sp.]|nr:MAG: hypothetical protein E6Q76_18560 [Rhizobium sp.]
MKTDSNDTTQEDAYELGRKAFVKGGSGDNNPFAESDPRRDKWAQGFMDGQKIRSDQYLPGHPPN